MQLTTDVIEDINRKVDCNNLSYARKTMIKLGMSLAIDGIWNVHQLLSYLQEIVGKYQ